MRGLRVNFSEEGASIDFEDAVTDFYSTVQNAVINVGTKLGTDEMYPEKGTRFFERAIKSGINTMTQAGHASNFAAEDTLNFYQDTDTTTTENKLKVFQLNPTSFIRGQKLEVDVYAESTTGETVQTGTTL